MLSMGLRSWGVFCVPSELRFSNPGLPSQPGMGRVTMHFIKYRIIPERENTHKTCPLDISV